VPAGVGGALLLVSLLGLLVDPLRFLYAYHIGWVFCISISVGALFFVMIQHVTKAKWVTLVRRFPEMLMANFVLLALLSLPIVFDLLVTHQLFHWTHGYLYDPADPRFDPIIAGKQPYLNVPFFLARLVVYFAVWIYLSTRLYRLSVYQDTDPQPMTGAALRKTSAWGIPVAGVVTSFASYDLLMSLDPHWFSSIFSIYFFAGGMQGAIASTIFMAICFRRSSPTLASEISPNHLHDLGKYLFGFTVFWTYIAFSQYMLIWYANLPEETVWYHHRFAHGWELVTWSLIIFKFLLPFAILLPRISKRTVPVLAVMSIWLLTMHWIDVFWIAMPNYNLGGPAFFSWIDVAAWLGLAGLYYGATIWRASRHATVPHNDPYMGFSLHFQNF
jgi:hypothetical protein